MDSYRKSHPPSLQLQYPLTQTSTQLLPSQSPHHSGHHRPPQAKPNQPGPHLLEPHHRRNWCLSHQETHPPHSIPNRVRRHDSHLCLLDRRERRLRHDEEHASRGRSSGDDLRVLHVLHDNASAYVRLHHGSVPVCSSCERSGVDPAFFEGWQFVQSVSGGLSPIIPRRPCWRKAMLTPARFVNPIGIQNIGWK